MADVDFLNQNATRIYPFAPGGSASLFDAAGRSVQLPDSTIVDFGSQVLEGSRYVDIYDSVYLFSVSRLGNSVTFEFRSSAVGLRSYALRFERHVADLENVTQFADAAPLPGAPAQICGRPAPWEGFLTTGSLAPLLAQLPDVPGGSRLEALTETLVLEPARTQNLSQHRVESLNLVNRNRTHVTPPDGCTDPRAPTTVPEFVINATCLVGDLKLVDGYSLAVRQNDRERSFNISATVGIGAGELCGEVPLVEAEQPFGLSRLLTGGPACGELVKTINGVSGSTIRLVGGQGVRIRIPADRPHTIEVDVDLHDLTICELPLPLEELSLDSGCYEWSSSSGSVCSYSSWMAGVPLGPRHCWADWVRYRVEVSCLEPELSESCTSVSLSSWLQSTSSLSYASETLYSHSSSSSLVDLSSRSIDSFVGSVELDYAVLRGLRFAETLSTGVLADCILEPTRKGDLRFVTMKDGVSFLSVYYELDAQLANKRVSSWRLHLLCRNLGDGSWPAGFTIHYNVRVQDDAGLIYNTADDLGLGFLYQDLPELPTIPVDADQFHWVTLDLPVPSRAFATTAVSQLLHIFLVKLPTGTPNWTDEFLDTIQVEAAYVEAHVTQATTFRACLDQREVVYSQHPRVRHWLDYRAERAAGRPRTGQQRRTALRTYSYPCVRPPEPPEPPEQICLLSSSSSGLICEESLSSFSSTELVPVTVESLSSGSWSRQQSSSSLLPFAVHRPATVGWSGGIVLGDMSPTLLDDCVLQPDRPVSQDGGSVTASSFYFRWLFGDIDQIRHTRPIRFRVWLLCRQDLSGPADSRPINFDLRVHDEHGFVLTEGNVPTTWRSLDPRQTWGWMSLDFEGPFRTIRTANYMELGVYKPAPFNNLRFEVAAVYVETHYDETFYAERSSSSSPGLYPDGFWTTVCWPELMVGRHFVQFEELVEVPVRVAAVWRRCRWGMRRYRHRVPCGPPTSSSLSIAASSSISSESPSCEPYSSSSEQLSSSSASLWSSHSSSSSVSSKSIDMPVAVLRPVRFIALGFDPVGPGDDAYHARECVLQPDPGSTDANYYHVADDRPTALITLVFSEAWKRGGTAYLTNNWRLLGKRPVSFTFWFFGKQTGEAPLYLIPIGNAQPYPPAGGGGTPNWLGTGSMATNAGSMASKAVQFEHDWGWKSVTLTNTYPRLNPAWPGVPADPDIEPYLYDQPYPTMRHLVPPETADTPPQISCTLLKTDPYSTIAGASGFPSPAYDENAEYWVSTAYVEIQYEYSYSFRVWVCGGGTVVRRWAEKVEGVRPFTTRRTYWVRCPQPPPPEPPPSSSSLSFGSSLSSWSSSSSRVSSSSLSSQSSWWSSSTSSSSLSLTSGSCGSQELPYAVLRPIANTASFFNISHAILDDCVLQPDIAGHDGQYGVASAPSMWMGWSFGQRTSFSPLQPTNNNDLKRPLSGWRVTSWTLWVLCRRRADGNRAPEGFHRYVFVSDSSGTLIDELADAHGIGTDLPRLSDPPRVVGDSWAWWEVPLPAPPRAFADATAGGISVSLLRLLPNNWNLATDTVDTFEINAVYIEAHGTPARTFRPYVPHQTRSGASGPAGTSRHKIVETRIFTDTTTNSYTYPVIGSKRFVHRQPGSDIVLSSSSESGCRWFESESITDEGSLVSSSFPIDLGATSSNFTTGVPFTLHRPYLHAYGVSTAPLHLEFNKVNSRLLEPAIILPSQVGEAAASAWWLEYFCDHASTLSFKHPALFRIWLLCRRDAGVSEPLFVSLRVVDASGIRIGPDPYQVSLTPDIVDGGPVWPHNCWAWHYVDFAGAATPFVFMDDEIQGRVEILLRKRPGSDAPFYLANAYVEAHGAGGVLAEVNVVGHEWGCMPADGMARRGVKRAPKPYRLCGPRLVVYPTERGTH